MQYRDFGKTGLKASALVFGGGKVGGLLIDQDDETRRQAVDRALAAGINWFDTAPSYGEGRSEAALGWLLSDAQEPPYVSTKFSIDTQDPSDVRGQIEASLEGSLERLRRDSVTLLQLHNHIGTTSRDRMLDRDVVLKSGGVLDVLDDLKRQGLIRHFGITALGETHSIIQVIESGRIDSAQVYFNMLNPSAALSEISRWPMYDFTGVLEACARHGVAAMNIRVFSAGVIATDARTGRELPITPGDTVESETEKARVVFGALGDRYGSRAATAIRFALAEPRLACVIFGLAELAHLEEALAAETQGPLPETALSDLSAAYGSAVLPR